MKIYVKSVNKWIEVSKEEHDNYYRDINAYRRTQQNHGRCTCPHQKYYMCDMDCYNCSYKRTDEMVSLDNAATENEELSFMDMQADPESDTAEIVLDKIYFKSLLERVFELMPEARSIGIMHLMGMTDTQIAAELEMPRTTMKSRLKKLRDILDSELSDIF